MGSPSAGSNTSGASFTGQSRDIDLDYNETFGIRAGYIVSDNFRFDISFYDVGSELDWMTDFPGIGTSTFTADIDSQILLVSAYYNFTTKTNFSPYLGLGIGYSRNKFKSGKEYFDDGSLGASVASNTETEFAYRLSIGTDYVFTENLLLNVDLSSMNIGDASSASRRTFNDGSTQTIGAYEFEDIWLSTLTMGLKYRF
jgi:opacity protein-like surface antigen